MTFSMHLLARLGPDMPPLLDGETVEQYTDRLTGDDGTGRSPFPGRNRQCSLGWHEECSELHTPRGRCRCECHLPTGAAR